MRSSLRYGAQFAIAIAGAACGTVTPGRVAQGVSKESVASLRLEMSEGQVLAIMGPALETSRGDQDTVLDYAYPGETKWGGTKVESSGLMVFVNLRANRLAKIVVFDVDRSKVCTCDVNGCVPNWLASCEAGLAPIAK